MPQRKKVKRNIGQEVIDSLREIKAGGGRRYRFTTPGEIRQIRECVGVSQANFARMLGISLRTLQDWEQGRRRPNQAAQSLLAVAAKRPDVMREVFE
jgi:putative transcriptional regulator